MSKKPRSILYWEAKRRLDLLTAYRQKIVEYHSVATWSIHTQQWNQPGNTPALRQQINEGMRDVAVAIGFVGVSPEVYYSPPPAIGGIAGNVSLLDNIFNLPRFQIPHTQLLDILDQAIGIYRSWLGPLRRKLFNPFYWIGQGLSRIAEVPFRILDAAGFNGTKAEGSTSGKLTKAVIQFVTLIGGGTIGALTILEKLDLLEATKLVLRTFFGV